ncbi:MAG: hypothetical protein PWP14_730 [Methanolobus sp.]|nr:hypothetical protein [Methanolobus sp.]
MRILAIDIGTGTQDIVLYDTEREVENSLLMVMPAPTVIVAGKVSNATSRKKDIFLKGSLMGGGPASRAVKQHLKQGLEVYATTDAALTINDNLEKVKEMGVRIVGQGEATPEGFGEIVLQDIDLEAIGNALAAFDLEMPGMIAVAVQDHGNSPDLSNRIYRFRIFERLIDEGGEWRNFAYGSDTIPADLTRMRAAAHILGQKGAVFMDTGPAAIFGALFDPAARQPSIVVNIGNGHTLMALVKDDRVKALYEHHTSGLSGERLQEHIILFAEGRLSFEDVFNEGGHGCYIKEAEGFDTIRSVMITGPRLNMLKNIKAENKDMRLWEKLHFAAPFGNMMLSGCYGLLASHLRENN